MPVAEYVVRLPAPHAGQVQILSEARRFNVVCCGRRFGKSLLGIEVALEKAIEGQPVAWFAPTFRLLTEAWRQMNQIIRPLIASKSETEHRIQLVTGGLVECWSMDTDNLARGRRYAAVVIDEAAMIRSLKDSWEQAIRPTLADLRGDAWFLSTPRGMNYFKALFDRGQDPEEPEWQSWQMPTARNPFIPAEEIEAARRELPERVFAQEFDAQFIIGSGAVFRNVLDLSAESPQEPVDGREYVIGVDWGKQADFTVMTVIDVQAGAMVWMDRSNQVDYHVQAGRLTALAERYRPTAIVAEANSMGEPIIEQLQRAGLPIQAFTTTNASKAQAIEGLSLAMETGSIRLLNDPVLVAELLAYEAERLPSGLTRYGAPAGQHDDCVMALALAWWGSTNRVVPWRLL